MTRYKKIILSLFFALINFGLFAAVRQVTGYGSSDDLERAVYAAQGDAVLNAGGKTTVSILVADEKLERDGAVSSNEVFLLEYEMLEKGESFDGIYARIRAKVCDVSEREFDNGKVVTGEGKGVTERAARASAIGNAILSLGSRVRAVGIFEKEELIKDEVIFTGWAYVSQVEELEKKVSDGLHTYKVRFKVFENKRHSGDGADVEKSAWGAGATPIEAMAAARVRAILDFNSSYVVRMIYDMGEFKSKIIKKNWKGLCYGTTVVNSKEIGGGWRLWLKMRFNDDVASGLAGGVSQGVGYGVGKDEDEAVVRAKLDAVLNSCCVADIVTSYAEGCAPDERMSLSGRGYIGKVDIEGIASRGARTVKVQGPVSRSESQNSTCTLDTAYGRGCNTDVYKSYLEARHRAVMNGGAYYRVDREYRGNTIVGESCDASASHSIRRFELTSGMSGDRDGAVEICMDQTPGDGAEACSIKGVGVSESVDVAKELARSDAALNFCSDVEANTKYDRSQTDYSHCRMRGSAYLAGCEISVKKMADGRYIAISEARAVRDGASGAKLGERKASFEVRGHGEAFRSVNEARRRMFIESGSLVEASAEYESLNMVRASALYRSEGILSGCDVDVSGGSDGAYKVRVGGRVSPLGESGYEKWSEVIGLGRGDTFEVAKKAAVEDAVLNANSRFAAEERYENGRFAEGTTRYDGAGCVFLAEVCECQKDGEGYRVKVLCDIASTRGDEQKEAEKEVTVKGWGLDEESAKADALRNAVDKVFGREVKVSMKEVDGVVVSHESSESVFEKGYVESSEVNESEHKMGLCEVEITAVVRQEGVDDDSWSWTGIILIILGVLALCANWVLGLIVIIVGLILL